MVVYGIKNCNSVKKAIDHLKKKNIDFQFHDYKKSGISEAKLKDWSKKRGWETLINKKGTTWRKIDDKIKESISSEQEAIKLMATHNSLIKRPIIENGDEILAVGYDEKEFSEKF